MYDAWSGVKLKHMCIICRELTDFTECTGVWTVCNDISSTST